MVKKLHRWLEKVYEKRICNQYDDIVLVVGDEGVGKSNTIIGLLWWWQQIRDKEASTERVLNRLVWDRDDFEDAMSEYPKRSAIAAMDAARILHKKKAMNPDQIEIETDLFDVRTKEHVMFLGFQDWDTVPSGLQKRRAQHALFIPDRGRVWGYGRGTLDERVGADEWPEPDLRDTFPALEQLDGPVAECWSAFQQLDLKKKQERIRSNRESGEDAEQEPTAKEIVNEILREGVAGYIKINEYNPNSVNTELIQLDYDISRRKAKTIAEGIKREIDPDSVIDGTGGDPTAGEGVSP